MFACTSIYSMFTHKFFKIGKKFMSLIKKSHEWSCLNIKIYLFYTCAGLDFWVLLVLLLSGAYAISELDHSAIRRKKIL
jgi:hypothetical protein